MAWTSSYARRQNRCSTRGWCTPFHYRNAKGNVNRIICCSGRIEGGNWPVAKVRPSRETCKSSERSTLCAHHFRQSHIPRQLGKETHLSDDKVLRKLCKSDDLVEHFGQFFKSHARSRVALGSSPIGNSAESPSCRGTIRTGPPPAVIPRKIRFSMALSAPVT